MEVYAGIGGDKIEYVRTRGSTWRYLEKYSGSTIIKRPELTFIATLFAVARGA